MNEIQKDIRLLPVIFKKVAFGIIVVCIIFFVLTLTKVLPIDKEVFKTVAKSVFLIALLILALTKSKIEDELLLRIRLQAFTGSFIFGVVRVMINPFLSYIFDGTFTNKLVAVDVMITMLLFYFMMLLILKRKR